MKTLIPILLFALSTTITPGPNNFMLLNAGLYCGIKKSLPLYFGICFGFPTMVLIVALGFGGLFVHYLWIKAILKIFGSLYLLYLALQIFQASSYAQRHTQFKPLTFLQAMMFQWVNPKAWLMAVSAISLFTLVAHYFYNALAISILFFLMCLPCLGVWLVFGSFLQKILKTDHHRRWFNLFMAVCLAASVLMIWLD